MEIATLSFNSEKNVRQALTAEPQTCQQLADTLGMAWNAVRACLMLGEVEIWAHRIIEDQWIAWSPEAATALRERADAACDCAACQRL